MIYAAYACVYIALKVFIRISNAENKHGANSSICLSLPTCCCQQNKEEEEEEEEEAMFLGCLFAKWFA